MPRWLLGWFTRHLSLYPPFIGAGIRVVTSDPDAGIFRTRMRLTWRNRNLLGTHFGGSLYAMCDPFFAVILMEQLGRGYAVTDKSASIAYLRPGTGTVEAEFRIPSEEVAAIRAAADAGEVVEPVFEVDVVDRQGRTIATVTKTVHVRKRGPEG